MAVGVWPRVGASLDSRANRSLGTGERHGRADPHHTGAGLAQRSPWRPYFLIPLVARAYQEAESLVKHRVTDVFVLLAFDINGTFAVVRVGVSVDIEKDIVDI